MTTDDDLPTPSRGAIGRKTGLGTEQRLRSMTTIGRQDDDIMTTSGRHGDGNRTTGRRHEAGERATP